MFRIRFSLSIILVSFYFLSFSQETAIGEWRDHFAFNKAISVAAGDERVYCATQNGIYYIDKTENSINKLTKINGLADIGINRIAWDNTTKTLVIAYANSNIDLLNDDKIYNLSDIKRKANLSNKTINNILCDNGLAYFSCSFGIVVLDIKKKEIKDTYIIGDNASYINVTDFTYNDTAYFASYDHGIYYAKKNSLNISDYKNWKKFIGRGLPNGKINAIKCFGNYIIANLSKPKYNSDTIYKFNGVLWTKLDTTNFSTINHIDIKKNVLILSYNFNIGLYNTNLNKSYIWSYFPGSPVPAQTDIDKDSIFWIADINEGLVRYNNANVKKFKPEGPISNNVYCMSLENERLCIVPGGRTDAWANLGIKDGISSFYDDKWSVFNSSNIPQMDTIVDILSVVVDPSNNKRFFAGSYGNGLLEFNDNVLKIHNETNSTLGIQTLYPNWRWLALGGICFDKSGNLWTTNQLSSKPISVYTYAKKWKSISVNQLKENYLGSITVDNYNQKWVTLPRDGGIVVFKEAGTIDNITGVQSKLLTTAPDEGSLISKSVNTIACDLDGKIWIGTNLGLCVIYNPENIFTNQNFDAQKILIEQDGHTQILLENENITSIVIDGANQKWIATLGNGVFLMSADGTKEIFHFTVDNSPLISNSVTCLAINQKNGEIFFGTSNGIVSYKNSPTMATEDYDNVKVYPNPVKSGYTGKIAIAGLVKNANVKITDVAGNLVYETIAEGGQAVWNGYTIDGTKASTGVYLVFCTNSNGQKTMVTKILFNN